MASGALYGPLRVAYLLRERRNGRNFNANELIGTVRILCTADTNGIKDKLF